MSAPSLKGITMSNKFKELAGKRLSKTYKFMDEAIEIRKLTVNEVNEIQDKAKSLAEADNGGFEILKTVIKLGAPAAAELEDEEFNDFPLDELSKLSEEIMKYSGISQSDKGK